MAISHASMSEDCLNSGMRIFCSERHDNRINRIKRRSGKQGAQIETPTKSGNQREEYPPLWSSESTTGLLNDLEGM